ncbi:MAG TPA: hypothetical protein VK054_07825 [Beutenbergiaceae bacterium]|nr:hypothetical protein [Beutenbergiaceae bacterium]
MSTVSIRHDVGGPFGLLGNRTPFRSHGAMSAHAFALSRTGRLPKEWVEVYRSDRENPGISYVVYSYATPIAWVRADGETVIPDVGYSLTTTRHQGMCRAWL